MQEQKSEKTRSYVTLGLIGLLVVCGTILAALGKLDNSWVALAGALAGADGIASVGYSLSRAKVKAARATNGGTTYEAVK